MALNKAKKSKINFFLISKCFHLLLKVTPFYTFILHDFIRSADENDNFVVVVGLEMFILLKLHPPKNLKIQQQKKGKKVGESIIIN